MSDSLYHHFERVFWQLLARVPAPGLIDEHWFLRELEQAGHPDPELSLHWALLTGELTLCGITAAGAWQLAVTTSTFATSPLYLSAGAPAQTAAGETYQALGPAGQRRLTPARFLGYAPGQPPNWYTLAELSESIRNTRKLHVHFGQGRRFDDVTASLLPEVGALTLSFDTAPLPAAAWYQLLQDPYLAAHWLLLTRSTQGQPLTAVVQLPTGHAHRERALAAIALYCQRRFQRLGCRCWAVPAAEASRLADSAQVWLHPSLRPADGRRDAA